MASPILETWRERRVHNNAHRAWRRAVREPKQPCALLRDVLHRTKMRAVVTKAGQSSPSSIFRVRCGTFRAEI